MSVTLPYMVNNPEPNTIKKPICFNIMHLKWYWAYGYVLLHTHLSGKVWKYQVQDKCEIRKYIMKPSVVLSRGQEPICKSDC